MDGKYTFDYLEVPNDRLCEEDQVLLNHALEAARSAYAPYSEFHVGAAVRLSDGTVITGSNQENAAYPSGTCAERTALFYANASHPGVPVAEIAIIALYHGQVQQKISPCGSCRQVMAEVSDRYRPYRVLLGGKDRTIILEDNRVLLPFTFDSSAL